MLARALGRSLGILGVAALATGCVLPPPADAPTPPRVTVLGADRGALRYGASASEVLGHELIRDKVKALFGADWSADGRTGRVRLGASEFFTKSEPPRLLRIGETTWVAVSGCARATCGLHRGLLLISEDGGELLSRLDEGGFSHYYAYGPGAAVTPGTRALLDGAWRALEPTLAESARSTRGV